MQAGRQSRNASITRPPEQWFHDPQPRPHPHHPCRQPAAQREAVRPADGAGGRQAARPEGAGGRDGQGGPPCRRRADGGRHRRRQRRRAAADRLPDLRAAAHVRLCRRVEAPPRQGVRGVPRAAGLSDAPLPESDQEPAGRARGAGRHQVSRSQADHRRDRGLQQDRRRARRVLRAVHDRGLARHHLDHDAQRPLRVARRLPRRDRARDEQGVPGDPQGRA